MLDGGGIEFLIEFDIELLVGMDVGGCMSSGEVSSSMP